VAFSAGLTILGILALAVWPEQGLWVLAAFVIDHLVLLFAGLWPRCDWIGSNWACLPPQAVQRGEVAITIDDGPEPAVTPEVLDLLDRHAAKATFFCIGERAAAHPKLCREIIRRGHRVENHSLRHKHNFSLLNTQAYLAELEAAQATLSAITGVRPSFFRAPAGLRNLMLDPVLDQLGLQLASWTRRGFDTRERDPKRVLASLLNGLKAGDILLLHDGNAARTSEGRPVILEVLPPLLEAISQAGLKPVTLADSRDWSLILPE
jgi:peptidoglycan/xylan/chitin deacetylase (PgdA/CDA1 family)